MASWTEIRKALGDNRQFKSDLSLLSGYWQNHFGATNFYNKLESNLFEPRLKCFRTLVQPALKVTTLSQSNNEDQTIN